VETAGGHSQEAPSREGAGGRSGLGGGERCPQPAGRQGAQDVGQEPPQEVARRRQTSYPLAGLAGIGLLGEIGRHPRHDLRRPGIPHQGERLWFDKTASIMALDQQSILLKMVVMVSPHQLTGRLYWSWLS
jgi:hypothetical protein